MEQRLSEWPKTRNSPGSNTDSEKTITHLETQVEEQVNHFEDTNNFLIIKHF